MSKFKVGDWVRIKRYCSGCEKEEIYQIDERGNACIKRNGDRVSQGGCSCTDNWELVENNQNIMSSLKEKFTLMFKGEPEASFIKAGVMNPDETLTEDGKTVYGMWRFNKDKEEFNKEIIQPLLEADKK